VHDRALADMRRTPAAESLEPVASVEEVGFSYGSEPVLDGVNLMLSSGELVALVGPNGAGKSTLLRIMLGLVPPTAGRVRLFGQDPRRLNDRWRIGYVPQRPSMAPDLPASVEEIVASGLTTGGRWSGRGPRSRGDAVGEALDIVGMAHLRRRLRRDLSGGEQQRALIARALVGRPHALFLDEPLTGIDMESQRMFREALVGAAHDRGAAVLLVSHELGAVADVLDRVVVLRRSVLFDGPPKDLSRQGVSLGIHRHDLPLWLEDLEDVEE
jgi:zinc transport system ATP-binding protein